jgi:glycosyltransferase involved in cell wall biosynthesis
VPAGERRTVFVDFSTLPPDGSSGGAAAFALKLLAALSSRADAHCYRVLVEPRTASALAALRGPNLRTDLLGEQLSGPRFLRRRLRRLPHPLWRLVPDAVSLQRLGADALFSPLFTTLFHESGLPHLAVAYDFQELSHPGFFDQRERLRRRSFRADLGRVDRVVAISDATRRDAVERVGIPLERIRVLPPVVGIPRSPLPPQVEAQALARHGLASGRFALYPANYWLHKNHERLLLALSRARKGRPEIRLVLCGALDAARERLASFVGAQGLADSVCVLPYLSDEDLTALLSGARFLVFPSLYEGFGIPVLEAMTLGTPVACSDLPALRELAGDVALFFDPEDETSIAGALDWLWSSEETRRRLSTGGLARAARYVSLDVAAEYHRLLEF